MTTKQIGHTPGTWKVNPRSLTKISTQSGLNIAQIFDAGGDGEEAQANARFIAACPELLEACKRINEAFLELEKSGLINNGKFNHLANCNGLIEEAIAKAEGETR